MSTPASFTITLREGEQYQKTFAWTSDQGAQLWSAGVVHSVNDVVQAFPAIVDPVSGNQLFYRCTAAGTSSSVGQPTWPIAPGLTVTDGTVVWTAQLGTAYPVDLTNCTAHFAIRMSPDDPNPAVLDLGNANPYPTGVVLGGTAGTIVVTITVAQIAALIALGLRYGYYDILITFQGGVTPVHPFIGPIEFARSAARS